MILKYTNSFEDFVELHLFLDTIKKSRIFYFKFRKIVLYACYLYFIVATIKFVKLYYLHTKIVVIFCIFILMIAIFLHKIVKSEPKFY